MSDLSLFFPQSLDQYKAAPWSFYRPDRHDGYLREIGVALPFDPVPEEVEWVCGSCGDRRTMGVTPVGKEGSLDTADVRFVPKAEDQEAVRCGRIVELQRVQERSPWGSTQAAKVIGPKQRTAYGYCVLETFEGPCPGVYDPSDHYHRRNDWHLADVGWEMEARRQIAFLILLPAWARFRAFCRGDYASGTPFPAEWMGPDFRLMSLDLRVRMLERVMSEVMTRMSVAGHALDIHGINYW